MKKVTAMMLFVLVATLLLRAAEAQEVGVIDEEPPMDEPLMRKVEQRVEMLRKWKILEALDPEPELADRLFPILSEQSRRDRELAERRGMLMEELRIVVRSPHPQRDHLADLLVQLRRNEEERCRLQESVNGELGGLLTVEQQARLLVAMDEFHQEVRQLIQQARRRPDRIPPERP